MAFLLNPFSVLNALLLFAAVLVQAAPLALPLPALDLTISTARLVSPTSITIAIESSSPTPWPAPARAIPTLTPDSHCLSLSPRGSESTAVEPDSEPLNGEDVQTNYRSVWDLLYACVATIFACTWVAVHPNVRGYFDPTTTKAGDKPNDGERDRLLQKTELMMWAIIAPEVVVVWAYRQWAGAREIQRLMEERMENIKKTDPTAQFVPWTLTHSHFLQMGGYIFKKRGVLMYVNLPPSTLAVALQWRAVLTVTQDKDRKTLVRPTRHMDNEDSLTFSRYVRGHEEEIRDSNAALEALVRSHLVSRASDADGPSETESVEAEVDDSEDVESVALPPSAGDQSNAEETEGSGVKSIASASTPALTTTPTPTAPPPTQADIDDRSKADGLTKAIAVVQTLWFIAQCIGRKTQGLHVTELEMTTLGYAALNGMMYWLWWHKPMDVAQPVVIEVDGFYPREEDHLCMVRELQPMGTGSAQPESQESRPEEKKQDDGVSVQVQTSAAQAQQQEQDQFSGDEASQAPKSLTWFEKFRTRLGAWLEPARLFFCDVEDFLSWRVIRPNSPFLWPACSKRMSNWYRAVRILVAFMFVLALLPQIFLSRLRESVETTLRGLRYVTGTGTVEPLPPLSRFPTFGAHSPGQSPSSQRQRNFVIFFVGPFLGIVVGAVHCAKWADVFPSEAHKSVWRVTSVFLAAAPVVIPGALVLARFLRRVLWFVNWVKAKFALLRTRFLPESATDSQDRHQPTLPDKIMSHLSLIKLIIVPVLLLYLPARLILIALSLAELRALPDSAKIDVDFEGYLPHF